MWSLVKTFKKRKFNKSYAYTDLNLQFQLTQDTINKLCPPSCLHLVWKSLSLMEEKDHKIPNINLDLEKPFNEIQMQVAINSAKLKSAPGIDQIDFNIISSLPNEYQIYS